MSERRNRRQFGKEAVALAAGAVVAGTGSALGQDEQPKRDARTIALQALMDMVRARYGAHLSDEQLKRVRQKIASGLFMAEALKKTRLENGDEPDFVFQTD